MRPNHCELCDTSNPIRIIKCRYGMYLCQACYQSVNRSDGMHPIPPAGEIHYSPEKGWPICHICGLAFRKVVQHAYNAHGISATEYKKRFHFNRRGILAPETRKMLQEHNRRNYKKVVQANLIDNPNAHPTRYKENWYAEAKTVSKRRCLLPKKT